MKTIRIEWKILLLSAALLVATIGVAQMPTVSSPKPSVIGAIRDTAFIPPTSVVGTVGDTALTPSTTQPDGMVSADSLPAAELDKAVTALEKGDKAASARALQSGISEMESQVKQKPSSFKDKILAQVGKLKALLPLITGGGLGAGVLGKAVGLAKLASGAGRLENLISAGSLIGKAGQLTSGLNGLGSAMSVLGGGGSTGKSLISTALSGVSKLGQGGMVAKAAEPAVKNQIGSVLNFVKGAL